MGLSLWKSLAQVCAWAGWWAQEVVGAPEGGGTGHGSEEGAGARSCCYTTGIAMERGGGFGEAGLYCSSFRFGRILWMPMMLRAKATKTIMYTLRRCAKAIGR